MMINDYKSDAPKVFVLMATYNGEKYIKEQIESILNQSYTNWELLVRDDGSIDKTYDILREYEKCDNRIKIIQDELGNIGQCANFNILMQYCENKNGYFMFSDQDDLWNNDKIEVSLYKIMDTERLSKTLEPTMIYTNYLVVDENLCFKNKAYSTSMNYSKKELASRLLVQNWIMGCTIIINKNLLGLSIGIPKEADNHDNWLAILCSLTGEIVFLNEVTMKHRIHSNNVTTQTKTTSMKYRVYRTCKRFRLNNEMFDKRMILLKHIMQRTLSVINTEGTETLKNYTEIMKTKGLRSLQIAYKFKFFGVNSIQTMLFLIQLLIKKGNREVQR